MPSAPYPGFYSFHGNALENRSTIVEMTLGNLLVAIPFPSPIHKHSASHGHSD